MALALNIKIHFKRFFIVLKSSNIASSNKRLSKEKKTEIKYLNFFLWIVWCHETHSNMCASKIWYPLTTTRDLWQKFFLFVNNLSCQFMRVTNSYFPVLYFHLPCYVSWIKLSITLIVTLKCLTHTTNCSMFSTTHRGSSGFDNSGRGYYFANQQGQRPAPIDRQPYSEPYDQAQRPQPTHINPYNPPQSQSNSQHTTPRSPPEFYQGKPAQPAQIQTVSSGTIGTVDSNSSMINKNSSNKEIDDKEKIR